MTTEKDLVIAIVDNHISHIFEAHPGEMLRFVRTGEPRENNGCRVCESLERQLDAARQLLYARKKS